MALPEQTGSARRRPTLGRWSFAVLAVTLGLAFVTAGCGSADDDEAGGATTAAATTGPGSAASVPDVADADLADAAQQLADEGLRVAVKYVPSNEPQGTVIGQSRPAGSELQRGEAVSLNVSIGSNPPANVPVPDATEQTEADGRAALEQAGFEVQTIKIPAVMDDVVVSHSPPAADRVPRGSLVILYAGG
jgi:beta-lactam-binding protein with PASTA domain